MTIATTVSFHSLGVKARMALLNDIRRMKSTAAVASIRIALLWVNTALDAARLGDLESAQRHISRARIYVQSAAFTESYHSVFPLVA